MTTKARRRGVAFTALATATAAALALASGAPALAGGASELRLEIYKTSTEGTPLAGAVFEVSVALPQNPYSWDHARGVWGDFDLASLSPSAWAPLPELTEAQVLEQCFDEYDAASATAQAELDGLDVAGAEAVIDAAMDEIDALQAVIDWAEEREWRLDELQQLVDSGELTEESDPDTWSEWLELVDTEADWRAQLEDARAALAAIEDEIADAQAVLDRAAELHAILATTAEEYCADISVDEIIAQRDEYNLAAEKMQAQAAANASAGIPTGPVLEGNTLIYTLVSGSDGRLSIPPVPATTPGAVTVVETQAPAGYVLDPTAVTWSATCVTCFEPSRGDWAEVPDGWDTLTLTNARSEEPEEPSTPVEPEPEEPEEPSTPVEPEPEPGRSSTTELAQTGSSAALNTLAGLGVLTTLAGAALWRRSVGVVE